jgi:hypothetical protein
MGDACQHGGEIGLGIDAVELGSPDQCPEMKGLAELVNERNAKRAQQENR